MQSYADTAWSLIKHAARSWLDDYAPSMGAALAYYTLFSIAPLLLIVISVAGLIFGEDAARGEISLQLNSLMGPAGASAVQDLLVSVRWPVDGSFATAIGLLMLLLGATTVFTELQDSLDRIWRVPIRIRSDGWVALMRSRLLSFGMILAIGFLLTVSLVISTMLLFLGKSVEPYFIGWYKIGAAANAIGAFMLETAMFALIFKVMPRVHVNWNDVWAGAIFTAMLFTLGKFVIGVYINHFGFISGFGAAGSLLIVLLWVYYSAQIFLFGAEFTWVYANQVGSRKSTALN